MSSKPLSVDDFLRNFGLMRDLYDRDAVFAKRVDAALLDKNTEADRRTWASQLGIDALAHPKEILNALAAKLGLKRTGHAPASSSPTKAKRPAAKPKKAVRQASRKGRRGTPIDTAAIEVQILGALKSGPVRSEQLRAKLGVERALFMKATENLLTSKKLKKTGEKRRTEYRLP